MNKEIYLGSSDVKTVIPIDELSIPDFAAWVDYNPFRGPFCHSGMDFAAYLTKDERCILGLPSGTVVIAISDGEIEFIRRWKDRPYDTVILLNHFIGNGFRSKYVHVVPLVEECQEVFAGQPIANLYHQQKGEHSPEQLIHLHFSMLQGLYKGTYIDPAVIIFPNVSLPTWEQHCDRAVFAQENLDEKLRHPETF